MRCSIKKGVVLRPTNEPTREYRAKEEFKSIDKIDMAFSHPYDSEELRRRIKKNHPYAWSYEDEEKLKKMYRRGYDSEMIASEFPRRSIPAVQAKIRTMKKRGEL